ncbi:Phd_YefM (plasmid) [Mycobacterium sp. JS623]|nr:Phd_YefM [Mycobacterium sp. JS623]
MSGFSGEKCGAAKLSSVATENIDHLRWTLDWVINEVARTGEEVIVLDRDGTTERAVIISMADYERLHEHADDVEARQLRAAGGGG